MFALLQTAEKLFFLGYVIPLLAAVASHATWENPFTSLFHTCDFQTIQAKAAIERQQAKIRALIEEQADRVEGERVAIEKRAGEQVRAAREEASRQAQEATRLEMELEKQVEGE